MDKNKHIALRIESSRHDLEVAETLLKSGKFNQSQQKIFLIGFINAY